jgi:hypothetical protein
MTAEIAIMNREAIALASDSAVTIEHKENSKIFTSANKLFALSKYRPIGIMVYGNAVFMGIPWETIIKVYRNKLGDEKFDTIEDQAENFINFLDNGNDLFSDFSQEREFKFSILSYFDMIKSQIKTKINEEISNHGPILDKKVKIIINKLIEQHYDCWKDGDNIPSIPKEFNSELIIQYEEVIEDAIKQIFEKLPLSPELKTKLKSIASNLFSKYPKHIESQSMSGIVIAGFGEKDIFPVLKAYHIESIINDRLKYEESDSRRIGDGEDGNGIDASVVPFAQRDMVDTFMAGVDPYYRNTEHSFLSNIFEDHIELLIDIMPKYIDKKYLDPIRKEFKDEMIEISSEILNEHNEKLHNLIRERYIWPITDVVSVLPKDELAAMAESLINLTSFKRKYTMQSETVGGPIDVAVISKNDGFIWIKRKHYFKPELNNQFFKNYYRGDCECQKKPPKK